MIADKKVWFSTYTLFTVVKARILYFLINVMPYLHFVSQTKMDNFTLTKTEYVLYPKNSTARAKNRVYWHLHANRFKKNERWIPLGSQKTPEMSFKVNQVYSNKWSRMYSIFCVCALLGGLRCDLHIQCSTLSVSPIEDSNPVKSYCTLLQT